MRQAREMSKLIPAILVLSAVHYSAAAEPKAEKSGPQLSERDRELDAMIDALANRSNEAPKLEGDLPRNRVFFGEEYDYKEQVRVFKAVKELKKRDGNELWPRLVAHVDDERYALTWETGAGTNRNMTVGKLCRLIAWWDINVAIERLSPTEVDEEFGSRPTHLVTAPDFLGERFIAWREKRKGKQLYEMQIDVLEWTMTEPGALSRLSEGQRDEYVDKVKAEIKRLKETREPVIDSKKLRTPGYYSLLSEARIKTYREGP